MDSTPVAQQYEAISNLGFAQFIDYTTHSSTYLDHIFIVHRNLFFFKSVVFDINPIIVYLV